MTSPFDDTEFIDRDLQKQQAARVTTTPVPGPGEAAGTPPNREEIETQVGEMQNRLAELKRAQEELERKRSGLEESRRRRAEFETGRGEALDNLTRGVGLLEETEFKARREAEQLAKTLEDFKEALNKVRAIDEKTWTKDSWNNELTKALTTIDNARMEWNSARVKWPLLNGESPNAAVGEERRGPEDPRALTALDFRDLMKLGFALSWPLALVALGAVVALVVLLVQR